MKMISLIYCVLVFILVSCEKKYGSLEREKYFDPHNIDSLALMDIDSFWDDSDGNITVSDYHVFSGLVNDTGFIAGYRYSGNEKGIAISVYTTRDEAIEAFNYRKDIVACVILQGESKEIINEQWWYSDCIPKCVFVNRWNTIIEVYYYYASYEEVKSILYAAANDIIQRVDKFSAYTY